MCVHTDLQAPHAGRVIEGGVEFSRPARVAKVSDIPNVNTMIVIHTRQPTTAGVKGQRDCVRVTGLLPAGEQLTEEEEQTKTEEELHISISVFTCVCSPVNVFSLRYLASSILAMSAPRVCGRGKVHRK